MVALNRGFAIFDSQCKTSGCSEEMCSSDSANYYGICTWKPEYLCNKDCRVRNFKCSFDEEFRQVCVSCIQDCKEKFSMGDSGRYYDVDAFENCTMKCSE